MSEWSVSYVPLQGKGDDKHYAGWPQQGVLLLQEGEEGVCSCRSSLEQWHSQAGGWMLSPPAPLHAMRTKSPWQQSWQLGNSSCCFMENIRKITHSGSLSPLCIFLFITKKKVFCNHHPELWKAPRGEGRTHKEVSFKNQKEMWLGNSNTHVFLLKPQLNGLPLRRWDYVHPVGAVGLCNYSFLHQTCNKNKCCNKQAVMWPNVC